MTNQLSTKKNDVVTLHRLVRSADLGKEALFLQDQSCLHRVLYIFQTSPELGPLERLALLRSWNWPVQLKKTRGKFEDHIRLFIIR